MSLKRLKGCRLLFFILFLTCPLFVLGTDNFGSDPGRVTDADIDIMITELQSGLAVNVFEIDNRTFKAALLKDEESKLDSSRCYIAVHKDINTETEYVKWHVYYICGQSVAPNPRLETGQIAILLFAQLRANPRAVLYRVLGEFKSSSTVSDVFEYFKHMISPYDSDECDLYLLEADQGDVTAVKKLDCKEPAVPRKMPDVMRKAKQAAAITDGNKSEFLGKIFGSFFQSSGRRMQCPDICGNCGVGRGISKLAAGISVLLLTTILGANFLSGDWEENSLSVYGPGIYGAGDDAGGPRLYNGSNIYGGAGVDGSPGIYGGPSVYRGAGTFGRTGAYSTYRMDSEIPRGQHGNIGGQWAECAEYEGSGDGVYCIVFRSNQPIPQAHFACGTHTNTFTKLDSLAIYVQLSKGFGVVTTEHKIPKQAYAPIEDALHSNEFKKNIEANIGKVTGRNTPLFEISKDSDIPVNILQPFLEVHLKPDNCYILDTDSAAGVFLWLGQDVDRETLLKCSRMLEKYYYDEKTNFYTPATIVEQGGESLPFKVHFVNWQLDFKNND